ncbi:hypothetical protein JCM3770_002465 [Rhodotorula araucariae]
MAHPRPEAMLSSDEVDWLVHSYLEESGYLRTAVSLLDESALARPLDHVVPPGHLIRLLQKGLLYLDAEARYRRDPPHPAPRIVGYPIPASLPLPPLPKYVPPPAPTPTPTPTPPPPPLKRKADKAPAAAAEEPAAAPSGIADAKHVRMAPSGETNVGAAPGKKAKGKERGVVADKDKDKERDKGAKGKEKEKDAEGDVSMDDTSASLPPAPPPAKAKDGAAAGAKGKERAPPAPAAAGSASSTKRERDKDDLRPPPAKKSAVSASSASSSSAVAAGAGTGAGATISSATAAKRSASPTVVRKAKPAPTAAADAPATPAPQNKFRITTTTKTVTTPVPVSAGAAAALAAQQQQRRRGSGDADAATPASALAAGTGMGAAAAAKKAKAGEEAPPAGGAGGGGLGKNGAAGPKSPTKGASPLKGAGGAAVSAVGGKEVDLKGVRLLKCEDKEVIKLKGHTQMKVQPCAFNSKVPSLLATGGADGTCRIWDVPATAPNPPVVTERMKCKHPSSSRRVDITAVAWDPSGSLLATATEDGIARIWTVSGDLHLVLSMHQRSISAMKWSPGGTMLLTASLDQTVCLWEVSNGKVRQQYSTHSDQVLDVDWNDDGMFASTSSDRMVHLLSTTRPTPLHRFRGHRDDVNVVKFSPCGTLVASCADDTTVRVWSLRNIGPIAREIDAKPVRRGDGARRIDLAADGAGGGGGGVWVLEGHGSDVHQVAWHPTAGKEGSDGPRLLASCSFDSTAKLWDADAGTCLYTFARASDFVYSISFEPTLGRYLATGSNDGRLDVWRVKDHALVAEYTHSGEIYELTWHPHGKQLAVCGGTEEVAVVPLLLGPSPSPDHPRPASAAS